jgi:hypothetical protein
MAKLKPKTPKRPKRKGATGLPTPPSEVAVTIEAAAASSTVPTSTATRVLFPCDNPSAFLNAAFDKYQAKQAAKMKRYQIIAPILRFSRDRQQVEYVPTAIFQEIAGYKDELNPFEVAFARELHSKGIDDLPSTPSSPSVSPSPQ